MADDDLTRLRALAKLRVMGTYREQARRWEEVQGAIVDAVNQVTSMRLDVLEEGDRDQGLPMWFSALITVAISLIPIGAATMATLTSLSGYSRSLFARLKNQLGAKPSSIAVESLRLAAKPGFPRAPMSVEAARAVTKTINDNEQRAAELIRMYAPEQTAAIRSLARQVSEAAAKRQFKAKAQTIARTDAPTVVISSALRRWVNFMQQAEGRALDHINYYIETSAELTEEIVDDFVSELQQKQLKLPADSDGTLKDLQLHIECCIWCLTFDFTPVAVPRRVVMVGPDRTRTPHVVGGHLEPIPLKPTLWKRMVERYIDPDENQSYKDVGPIAKLGSGMHDLMHAEQVGTESFTPETRLSAYLGMILAPQLERQQQQSVQRILSGKAAIP